MRAAHLAEHRLGRETDASVRERRGRRGWSRAAAARSRRPRDARGCGGRSRCAISNGARPSHSGPSVRSTASERKSAFRPHEQPDRRQRRRRQVRTERAVAPEDEPASRRRAAAACAAPQVRRRAVGVERVRGELVELGRRPAEEVHRLGEAHVDLRLGQRLGRRRHDRRPHLRVDLRVALREDGELPLLVAERRRQHVVGELGRLGHRRIDHDEQVELLARLAPALRVRVREERIRALDDERADALGVVDQDLLGHQRRREHAGVAERADRRDARRERALGLLHEARVDARAAAASPGRCRRPGVPTLPVSTRSTRIRYEISVENGACSTPRSKKIAADSALGEAARGRRRSPSTSRPQRARHLGDVDRRRAPARSGVEARSCARRRTRSSTRPSRTITAASASSR